MDLSVEICGVKLKSPTVVPSGVYVAHGAFMEAIEAGVGAITTKSTSVEPRKGNPFPRLVRFGDYGYLNSVGLANPGIEKGSLEITQLVRDSSVPVIASIVGFRITDFDILVPKIVGTGVSIIEVNLSCPNVEAETGAKPWATDPKMSWAAIKRVKKLSGSVPVIAKLSPNVTNIVDVARAVINAGADGICAINSVGPGLLIDIEKKKSLLGAGPGGVTGPAIFPIALRSVFEIHKQFPDVPIIGMGGVACWEDAIAMIEVGATAIGVGSSMYLSDKKFGLITKINAGIKKFMGEHKIKSLDKLRGSFKG